MSTPVTGNVCTQCGQPQTTMNSIGEVVTARMLHLAAKGIHSTAKDMMSYHLDCLPHELELAHRERHGSAIAAAKNGTRGDELRAVPDDIAAGFDADDQQQHDAWVAAARKEG